MKSIIFILIVCLAVSSFSQESSAKKRKKKGEVAQTDSLKKSKLSKFDEFFKARTKTGYRVNGMIDQFVNGRDLYFILPVKLLGQRMLFGSTIEKVSDNGEAMVGEKPYDPILVCFTKDSVMIQIRQDLSFSDSKDPNIRQALETSNVASVLWQIPIIAYNNDSTAILFNVKDLFFGEDIPELSAISPYATNSYYGNIMRSGKLERDECFFTNARGYEDNVSASATLSYRLTARFWGMFEVYRDRPYTAVMNRTLMLLPQEPMKPRIADPRVGVFPTGKYNYSLESNEVGLNWFANRWRLEPADPAAFERGELVEPKKPIVFYIDDAFPQEWVKYIRLGLTDWNVAFEKIGYKNAVQCKDFPTNDPKFDPNNLKFSCIRYVPTIEENSMGPSWVDPRTGEILNASIYIYHDIVALLNKWRFIQTAAADDEVRMMRMPEEILGDAIRYVVAHEMGHCLGLMHNMGASASIPTDSLRSATYTQKHGTTTSIMDYARYNYVAQPGDKEKGVRLTPPQMGVYDEYVIHWVYGNIPGAKTPMEEVPTLNKWINEKSGDPAYRYGKQQIYTYDPSSQSESLGDDGIKSSRYGIQNLKYIYKNMPEWIQGDQDYRYKNRLMYTLSTQYFMYMNHVLNEIGGIYLTEHKEGDHFKRFETVSREKQQKALAFIMEQLNDMTWLNDYEMEGMPLSSDFTRTISNWAFKSLWNRKRNVGLAADKANKNEVYPLNEYVTDICEAIFKPTRNGKKLNEQEKFLQDQLIASLLGDCGYKLPGSGNSFGFKDHISPEILTHILKEDHHQYQKLGIHSGSFYDLQEYARQFIGNEDCIAPPEEVSGFYFQNWVNFKEANTASIYFGMLEQTTSWMKQAMASADSSTKAHYQYLLNFIDKVSKEKK